MMALVTLPRNVPSYFLKKIPSFVGSFIKSKRTVGYRVNLTKFQRASFRGLSHTSHSPLTFESIGVEVHDPKDKKGSRKKVIVKEEDTEGEESEDDVVEAPKTSKNDVKKAKSDFGEQKRMRITDALFAFQQPPAPKKRKPKVSVESRSPLVFDKAAFPFAAKTFNAFGLSEHVVQQLNTLGIDVPTDVQVSAIPTVLKGNDAVIQSYTGSGKTLAFLLPILSTVGPLRKGRVKSSEARSNPERYSGIEAVIVTPSRELGMQIVKETERLLGPEHRKAVQQLVGGANKTRQEDALKKNRPQIVVGTPGRIYEISLSGKLLTHACKFLVLDEVDQLLSPNFRENMQRILEHVGRRKSGQEDNPKSKNRGESRVERQTVLVSATITPAVLRAANSWCLDPLIVRSNSVCDIEDVETSNDTSSNVKSAKESMPPSLEHYYTLAQQQHKVETLRKCINALGAKTVIVFMNHGKQLKDTVFKLEARGVTANSLHGDLTKMERASRMAGFKKGEFRVLVTNELVARGLDVINCDLVVNLDLPTDVVHYAHRAGRTGRLGQKGIVVSIGEEREEFIFTKFQRLLGTTIQQCNFTGGKLNVKGDYGVEGLI